jgi:hypothetical protein
LGRNYINHYHKSILKKGYGLKLLLTNLVNEIFYKRNKFSKRYFKIDKLTIKLFLNLLLPIDFILILIIYKNGVG